MPGALQPVPVLPHFFPDVGVGGLEKGALRLRDGRFTVHRGINLAFGVLEQKCKGHCLSLHHTSKRRENLRQPAHFN